MPKVTFHGDKPKVYHLGLIHLIGLSLMWPHPLARAYFETELHLKRALERKMLLDFCATQDD